VPLAVVLAVGCDFGTLALLVAELKLAKITIFLYVRFLVGLWVFFFLNDNFQAFSVLEVIFEIPFIRNTFTIGFFTTSLSFSLEKLTKILPHNLPLNSMT
jgi:hypothetical protein